MRPVQSTIKALALMLASLVLTVTAGHATGAVEKFVCDGTPYTVISNPSKQQRVEDDLTIVDMHELYGDLLVNGIGYNILDNYIYAQVGKDQTIDGEALEKTGIVKIAADGNWTYLGKPSSGPYAPVPASGTMNSAGNYYVMDGANKKLYVVTIGTDPEDNSDINSSEISLSRKLGTVYDLTFNVTTGKLYGVQSNKLFSIDTGDGNVTEISTSGDTLPGSAGGAWSTSKGEMYFYDNVSNPGCLYKVIINDSGTAEVTDMGEVDHNAKFDATACRPPFITKEANTTKVAPGGTIMYHFKIYNPFTRALDVNFTDPLPAHLSYDDSTLTDRIDSNGDNAGGAANFIGIDELNISGITLPISGWVEFNVTVNVDNPGLCNRT